MSEGQRPDSESLMVIYIQIYPIPNEILAEIGSLLAEIGSLLAEMGSLLAEIGSLLAEIGSYLPR